MFNTDNLLISLQAAKNDKDLLRVIAMILMDIRERMEKQAEREAAKNMLD